MQSYLTRLGCAEYLAAFIKEKMDLESLALASKDDLEKLHIPMGPRLKIYAGLHALTSSSLPSPSSSSSAPGSLFTATSAALANPGSVLPPPYSQNQRSSVSSSSLPSSSHQKVGDNEGAEGGEDVEKESPGAAPKADNRSNPVASAQPKKWKRMLLRKKPKIPKN